MLHSLKHTKVVVVAVIPHDKDDESKQTQFTSNPPCFIVSFFSDIHDCINHQEVKCMQRTDVVQYVRVAVCETKEDD